MVHGKPDEECEPWLHEGFFKLLVLMRSQARDAMCQATSHVDAPGLATLQRFGPSFTGVLLAGDRVATVTIHPSLVPKAAESLDPSWQFQATMSVSRYTHILKDKNKAVVTDGGPAPSDIDGVDFIAHLCAAGLEALALRQALATFEQENPRPATSCAIEQQSTAGSTTTTGYSQCTICALRLVDWLVGVVLIIETGMLG